MKKFIEKISTTVPYTKKRIDIDLKGKNLIITGVNGSGKTSLVNSLHEKLVNIVRSKKLDNLPQWERGKKLSVDKKNQAKKGSSQYQQAEREIVYYDKEIESVTSDPRIEINDHLEFSRKVDSELGVIELFPAVRESDIHDARSASGTNYNKVGLDAQIGSQLGQHLVDLYVRRSLSITENKNPDLEKEITSWLLEFDENLKFLMEDDSVYLNFDADNFKVNIHQDGKIPYTFQNLSSGYSSIFSVFSRLLMRTKYLKVSPSKLCGVAIIDELDAHLHVTLQRKILPFLADSFPGIQYIVTTHSPFVLTSVSNSEIYDISRREQVSDDLSLYSYESVLEGLFGVSPASNILQNKIRDIAERIKSKDVSNTELQNLIDELEKNQDALDEESKFYLNSAKLKINKSKKRLGK